MTAFTYSIPRTRLPWHHDHWRRLITATRTQRLGHAWLLLGMAGLGKRHFADLLTQALLCRQPLADGAPCGSCQECHLVTTGQHPDNQHVQPAADSVLGEIKVDTIRELTAQAALTPHRAARKVIQIHPAEAMNRTAANALLKTLEEPSPSTLLLLIADDATRLPATVRSRCQHLLFVPPPAALALDWLRAVGGQAPAAAQYPLLLQLAAGAPLRALTLAADTELLAARATAYQAWLRVGRGQQDPLAAAVTWQSLDPHWVLDTLTSWLVDIMRLGSGGAQVAITNLDQRADLTQLARRCSPAAIHQFTQQVLKARRLLNTSVNKQLLLESLLIRWAMLAMASNQR
ncbi:DNA polymerase III subunit delta' [Rhodoferax sp. 4810]|uniref:DNA polymerase III subunit delta' n=1 Tax=Thiospirillum jenense TaxID=1653858 RepID=A0A839HED2_9GAMM|nr:DNA polymerase III subunit delta' [Thiospirillum jenense]MBB1077616.1 DNA polymerase III subunit delta' [Rhodoferax jenense]MBB1127295.1 DNA polymerase III subunit delta' [Thiospirillum jenense]